VSLITWPKGDEASIGCTVLLDWDRIRAVHPRVAPVAIVGYATAQALRAHPAVNRRVALWGIRPHRTVRVSFAVDTDAELRIGVVDDADARTPHEFQRALIVAARSARSGTSRLGRATSLLERTPVVIGRPVLRLASLIVAGFGVGAFGVPGAPFGAALISSIDRFDLPAAQVPLIPFMRCAIVCSVGAMRQSPVVRNGVVVAANTIELGVTIDHRVADGAQLAGFLDDFEAACYRRDAPGS
jgi:pyruvate dehydrogenase E2 component (dihydrolipoamide acetyltransferase)